MEGQEKNREKATSKLFKHLPSLNLIVTQSTQNVELFVFNELQALEYLSCTRSHYLQVLAIFLRFVAIREQGGRDEKSSALRRRFRFRRRWLRRINNNV